MNRFPKMLAFIAGWVALSSGAVGAAPQSRPGQPAVGVYVDPRVELLSIVFRVAGSPEYGKARVDTYAADVDKQFEPYRNHAVVELARKLRSKRGISFDAVMSMAVHITDTESIREKVPFDPRPATLDQRWMTADARELLLRLRAFVKDSDFNGFFREHQKLYETAASRMQDVLRKNAHLEWFEAFFGARPGAEFTAVPGMLNGGSCYGVRCRRSEGKEELFCILGVWMTDGAGQPQFDKSILSTVIHEFTHSYSNPVVDRHLGELEKAGETLYGPVAETMKQQAYGSWDTMMRESLVRACVVRYQRKYDGAAAALATQQEKGRGFEWMPGLVSLLGEYESNRAANASLDAFMPRIVAYFNEYAPKFAWERKALNAKRPKVVSMTPANGASNVSADLKAIRMEFDRPMRNGSWSVVGGGPHFPELNGKPSYDAECKVLTIPVKLKPAWSYEFWLNSERFNSFASREGVPLEPVHVTFQTAGGAAE